MTLNCLFFKITRFIMLSDDVMRKKLSRLVKTLPFFTLQPKGSLGSVSRFYLDIVPTSRQK